MLYFESIIDRTGCQRFTVRLLLPYYTGYRTVFYLGYNIHRLRSLITPGTVKFGESFQQSWRFSDDYYFETGFIFRAVAGFLFFLPIRVAFSNA